MIIGTHETHALADAFPLASEDRIASLADSIQCNGLRVKPVLFEGKILDGRNRCLALLKLGMEIEFEEFQGDLEDAIQFVIDTNFERRDLSLTDRIKIPKRLGELKRLMIKEAKSKQVRIPMVDPMDKELLATLNATGTKELKEAHKSGLIPLLARAAEVAAWPEERQRALVADIQAAQSEPNDRAVRPGKMKFAVLSAGDLDSIWDRKAKADEVAERLSIELSMAFRVVPYEVNRENGAVE